MNYCLKCGENNFLVDFLARVGVCLKCKNTFQLKEKDKHLIKCLECSKTDFEFLRTGFGINQEVQLALICSTCGRNHFYNNKMELM